MLTAIRVADGQKVRAALAFKLHAPFHCPACGNEVFLAKGRVRIHHFRHYAEERQCPRSVGESEQHYECKSAVFEALQASQGVSFVKLEHRVGRNIADVFAVIRGVKVAIEIQRSTLSVEAISERTRWYHQEGVFVLWLALLTEDACLSEYSPSAWERWCHAAYGGRVYYWVHGQTIQPIHFGPHTTKIAPTTWVGRDRLQHTAGGYDKVSKRYRNPMHGERVEIADAFVPRKRPEWSGGTVHVPRCSLYLDRQPVWWALGGSRGAAK